MNPLIGYFVFFDLGNGCFGSKYGNLFTNRLFVESAVQDPTPATRDIWVGDFVTVWLNDLTQSGHTRALLHIRPRTADQYILEWREDSQASPVLYWGEGMVSNGQLVGSYWNPDMQAHLPARPDVRRLPLVLP